MKSGWTLLAKQWPEEKKPVLVATERGLVVAAWEWVAGRRWWVPTGVVGEYGYECSLSSHHGDNCDTAATHWMPLPPAPEICASGNSG